MKSFRVLVVALSVVVCAGIGISPATAFANGYPNRPVTLIVTMAAGGTTDIVARHLAQKLSESLGQTFIVDNKPGAGGNIGSQYVAKAPKDGYTLMVQLSSTQVINPSLYNQVGFDPIKDFDPIATLVKVPYALIVSASSPIKSLSDLITAAKEKPLQYGSAGNGTPNHLIAEMLASMANVKFEHIPYKGAAFATNAVAANEVTFAVGALPSVMGLIKGKMVRPIAITSEQRSSALPDVPPIAETIPGFNGDAWVGLFAPAGTPKEIIQKLQSEIAKIAATPDFRSKLEAQGATIYVTASEQFSSLIKEDLAKWAKIVKTSGAQVN